MQIMLIDKAVLKRFEKDGIPQLLAYGTPQKGSLRKILVERLKAPATVWTFPVEVPICGDVFSVKPDEWGSVKLFDGHVKMLDYSTPSENIEVVHSVGGFIYCKKTNKPATINPRSRRVDLLLYSAGGMTLLADVVDGPDCFNVLNIFTNDRLPMKYLLWRPERREDSISPEHIEIKLATDESGEMAVSFAVTCEVCDGRGTLTCNKCNSSGEVTCKKCDGSGDHYSAKGNRYDCSACDGSGTWSCNSCNGDGTVSCYACRETGYWSLMYDEQTHTFTRKRKLKEGGVESKEYAPHEVFLCDWNEGKRFNTSGARAYLNDLSREYRQIQTDRECRETLCREFLSVKTCLQRSMEAAGSQVLERSPFRLGNRQATKIRTKNYVVYEFSVLGKRPKCFKKGCLPFPVGTIVTLNPEPSFSKMIGAKNGNEISFHGVDFEKGSVSLRFPIQCRLESIAEEFDISPTGCAKPAEETQIQYLQHWCDTKNFANPILGAMVGSNASSLKNGPMNRGDAGVFFNSGMLNFPSQCQAVRQSLSEAPLVLLKGPPGTGKTTVITEIVRQAVKRGERVLITSQTHQAVQNVLERLHWVGGYRMIRHYSKNADPSKLTRLEKQYTEHDGSGGIEEYFLKLAAVGVKFRKQESEWNDAEIKINVARQAEEDWNRLRGEYEKNTSETNRIADQKFAAAKTCAESRRESAVKRRNKSQNDYRVSHKKLSKEKSRLERKLLALINRSESLSAKLKEAPSPADSVSSSRNRFRCWMDLLLPDLVHGFLKNSNELTKRLQNVHTDISQTKVLLDENGSEFEKIEEMSLNEEQLYVKETADADAEHAESRAKIEKERNMRQTDLTEEFRKEESRWLVILKDGLDAALSVGFELHQKTGVNRWEAPLTWLVEKLAELRKRLILYDSWQRDAQVEASAVSQYFDDRLQVFFSTCVGLASWRKVRGKNFRFDIVIVDEAAHATMPETLIPVSFGKRVVLVGDEKQLPPVVAVAIPCRDRFRRQADASPEFTCIRNTNCDCWLEESLFARLWDAKIDLPRTMLDIQFRMHPVIGDFVSETFYGGNLKNGIEANDRLAVFESFTQPVCLVPTQAYREQRYEESIGTSFQNLCEAKLVARILETANREFSTSKNDKLTFGIVTPYAAQVDAIKRELKGVPKLDGIDFSENDIASVDKYQGSERDVIIISFVRSPKPCGRCLGGINRDTKKQCKHCNGTGLTGKQLGFVRELRRLNVAFSRAKRQLILVGDIDALHNPYFLGSEAGRQVLEKFNAYVQDRGRVLRVWEGDTF